MQFIKNYIKLHHLAQGQKCVIYRLDIIFSITHVSQINFFCQRDSRRYPQQDIGRKISNFMPCQEVEKWQWLIVSMNTWLRYLKKLQFMLTEQRQMSNLRSQDVSKEIVSDLVRNSFHFQYATREMCKGVLNNYSMLKLRFFNQHPHFCNVL